MGLLIEQIIVATNSNDYLSRALKDGQYARGEVAAKISPAMDIQFASNFERLYFEAVKRESTETSRAFRAFAEAGAITIPPGAHAQMKGLFSGVAVSEGDTARTILATYNETGELIDPHTAVAVAAAQRRGAAGGTPMIALSTAHPAKFPEAVKAAAGVEPALPGSVGDHSTKVETIDRLPADAEAIKAYVRAFAGV